MGILNDKIKRHVAWLIKLKSNWLKWKRKQSERENFSYLSLKELNESEIYLLQRAQQDTYPEEFNKLLHNKDIDKGSKIIALNPTFNDKQLICVGGTVKVSDIFANSNHQIIISRHHPIAKLIIKHYHEQYLHMGREQSFSWAYSLCYKILFIL